MRRGNLSQRPLLVVLRAHQNRKPHWFWAAVNEFFMDSFSISNNKLSVHYCHYKFKESHDVHNQQRCYGPRHTTSTVRQFLDLQWASAAIIVAVCPALSALLGHCYWLFGWSQWERSLWLAVQLSESMNEKRKGKALEPVTMVIVFPHCNLCLFARTIFNFLSDTFSIRSDFITESAVTRCCFIIPIKSLPLSLFEQQLQTDGTCLSRELHAAAERTS